MIRQHQPDPIEAFAELGRINLAENDLPQVLSRVSELAKRTIPGASEVSVTLLQDSRASTAAYTGELALHLDEQQYEQGYGPCLEAAQAGVTLQIVDMAAEERWPAYVPCALERGARSSLSVGLPIQHAVTGALNIYATEPNAFDVESVALAENFAGYAAVALANAHLYSTTAALAEQMQQAMASRAAIEQAKGVLIAQTGCTPDQAFDLLSRRSQNANRKLRDVAAQIVAAQIVAAHSPPSAGADASGRGDRGAERDH
jgi:GAF domain-containing protein